jgi:cytochrome bd-type quinol oxidase subunit 2
MKACRAVFRRAPADLFEVRQGGRWNKLSESTVFSSRNPGYALTAENAKAGAYGLKVGLVWWSIGILLATGYFTFVYRSFAGKVDVGQDSHP